MDARITKQRLSNLLAYDWLKIVIAIVLSVTVLSVFFTMVRTRPTDAQTYTVYGYTGVYRGQDFNTIGDSLKSGVFSYDVLETTVESFEGNAYSNAAFSARRAAGEGTVLFVSDFDEDGEEGEKVSDLHSLVTEYLIQPDTERETLGLVVDVREYIAEGAEYLKRFFGENWREGSLDEEAARACFEARNSKDKRFRFNREKYEAGVKSEYERLEQLRKDYIFVLSAFEEGTFTYTEHTTAMGNTYAVGIRLGALKNIANLFYYTDGSGAQTALELNLTVLNNSDRLGDLKYETYTFLRYLAEKYA